MFWKDNKKHFFLLWLTYLVSSVVAMCFSIMNGNVFFKDLTSSQILLNYLIEIPAYGAIIFFGLWLAAKVGFTTVAKKGDHISLILKPAIIGGALLPCILFPMYLLIMNTAEKAVLLSNNAHTPMGTPLNAFFISIHAGISEEIVFRLFLTTLLIWLTRKCYSNIHDDRFAVWVGILLAGIFFGAAHLPAISVLGLTLTVPLAAKIIMFNATCGIFFGYMYWRYSLVTAMLTHIIVDIAIYTAILPLYTWLF